MASLWVSRVLYGLLWRLHGTQDVTKCTDAALVDSKAKRADVKRMFCNGIPTLCKF